MSVSRMMETAAFLHELTQDDFSLNLLGFGGSVLGFEYGILVSFHHLLGKQVVRAYSNAYLGITLIFVSSLSFESRFVSPAHQGYLSNLLTLGFMICFFRRA